MIRDLERELPERAERDSTHADVCIVGAGAAGIVLAVELARLGRRVLLLEAGGREIEEASQEPYASEVVGLPHRGIHTGRFRAHGGTTHRWGGQILELDPIDFEPRDWVPGSGWPFPKSELTGPYARALELEGLAPAPRHAQRKVQRQAQRSDPEVWRELGIPAPRFRELAQYFTRWTPQPNFAVLHRAALQGDKIAVWLHANAVGLDFDALAGEQVRGIQARTLAGRAFTFRAAHYAFCLGAIESSRFFLQPREGGLPWNRSGLLGRHFQDHIDANAAELRILDPPQFHAWFDNVYLHGFKYHPKIRWTEAAMRDRQTLNAGATPYFLSDVDAQLGAIKETAKKLLRGGLANLTRAEITSLAANLPLLARQTWRYQLAHRAWNPPGARVMLRVHCEQEPLGPSSITLSGQRDALGLLRTRLDWQISPAERRTILEFARTARQELAGLAELTLDPGLERGDDAFLARCDDSNHHMGGMRMAPTDSAGVVSPDLRLFGTRNAFVCSAAVFPTSGFSNPTHTLLALAVRLARHLTQTTPS